MMKIHSNTSILEINPIARSNPKSEDYWDGNWLNSEIKFSAIGIHAIAGLALRAEDFLRFYQGLKKMQETQNTDVEFATMEEGIFLLGKPQFTGNILWDGTMRLSNGENSLTFTIETDFASLAYILSDLNVILKNYPVVGSENNTI